MKQEIVCPECKAKLREMFPSDNPYPGEHVKFTDGIAKKDYRCDNCDTPIKKDTLCTAFSVWADHGRVPYYPWENNFITTKEESL